VSAFEQVRFAALTDVGVKRSHNQDACAAQPAVDAAGYEAHGHVFVVADGMGGHAVGEKASAKAVRDIPFIYAKHARDGVLTAIRRAFQETNAGIYSIGQQNPEFRGLGTTSTALILRPEGAWVGHVGDSRAYRIRDGKAEQLTFDHSWVWEIAKRQGVDPDELGDFKKNVIIRSLGPDADVEVDIEGPHPVRPGDTFLLCSDGLTGVVTPQEVGAVVSALSPEEAVRFLVHLANLRGGPDNITVMIVHVPNGNGGWKGAGGAGLGSRLFRAWARRVPWPFSMLGAGCGVALLSLFLRQHEVDGAPLLFLIAAGLIGGGVVGMLKQMQKEPVAGPPEPPPDAPRELHVYKTHDCSVNADLAARFVEIEGLVLDDMRSKNTPADYAAHTKLAAAATAADTAPKPDPVAAFRARCASLLFLVEAYHKAHRKEEAFRPNWTPPANGS
jgi:protein phosphatase